MEWAAVPIVEMGRVDPRSLFARFDFTRDELLSGAETWLAAKRRGPAAKPDELRTYVHELTHYQQLTTTPYGLFLQYCKKLQNEAASTLVSALLAAGYPITQPVLYNVPPTMPAEVADQVGRCLSGWLNIEELVAALDGNRARRAALRQAWIAIGEQVQKGAHPLLPSLLGWQQAFALVQDSLAKHVAGVNQKAREHGNENPVYPDNIDQSAISTGLSALSAPPNDEDRRAEMREIALGLLNTPWDVDAIVESQATAAEFWESDATYDTFTAWVQAKDDPELSVYRMCLRLGLDSIKTSYLPSFLASYMTLCEIALFAPLLPQHAALRASSPGFEQLLPTTRFQRLLMSAAQVKPMQGMSDRDRYVRELCNGLGWVLPDQIVKSAVDGPQPVSDPLTVIYLQAQRWRTVQGGGIFTGVDQLLFDPSPEAEQWRQLFNFVIVDFKDRTTYTQDKNFLETVTTSHLSTLGMEALMVRDTLTIKAPYGRSAAENQWMTEWLRNRFKVLFGRDFPDLQFVP
jgi:hypothetical protein